MRDPPRAWRTPCTPLACKTDDTHRSYCEYYQRGATRCYSAIDRVPSTPMFEDGKTGCRTYPSAGGLWAMLMSRQRHRSP